MDQQSPGDAASGTPRGWRRARAQHSTAKVKCNKNYHTTIATQDNTASIRIKRFRGTTQQRKHNIHHYKKTQHRVAQHNTQYTATSHQDTSQHWTASKTTAEKSMKGPDTAQHHSSQHTARHLEGQHRKTKQTKTTNSLHV